jgi:CHASE2 domain-containing sensor protein
VLLNWRGKPFSYHYVSFSDVYTDMGRKDKTRPQDEFKDKIIIIGSTAPSLFDIKPTPMSKMHQGVEILATAIDNMKHGDYLRFPEARVAYLLLTLLLVWVTAWAFYRNVGRDKIDRLFGLSQFLLIGISYASINLTPPISTSPARSPWAWRSSRWRACMRRRPVGAGTQHGAHGGGAAANCRPRCC